ncbi:PAS domain S-box protein [Deinococcus sp. HMF7604]|uniref:PAS domain-containing sensor histidine kinase n=1 Tax=Deinococcus betulae TaxID=2873312 RepID=UPI001CCE4BEF|nr:PAS domain S-box protein [Deinococcus betulae]MBZ9749557.1 PAS domain S-box protein [Deinococcus betulae]
MPLEEQRTLARLAGLVQGVVWQADPQTRNATFVSERLTAMTGFTPQQWLTTPGFWEAHLHPEDRVQVMQAHARSMHSGEALSLEYRFFAADGRVLWLRDLMTPVMEGGQLVALGGVMLDVTAEREQQGALRAARDRFEQVFQTSPVGLALIDTASGQVQQANPAFWAVVGGPLADLYGAGPHGQPLWTESQDQEALRAALTGGQAAHDLPARWQRQAGPESPAEVRDVRLSAEPLDAQAGTSLLTVEDVTERLKAETQLKASERRFRALVQHSHDLLTVVRPDGELIYASPAMSEVLGHDGEAVRGEQVLDHMHPDEHDAIRAEFAKAVFGGPGATARLTSRFRRRDGQYRYLEWVATNQLDDPHIRGMVMNSRDVTERVESEQALQDSQKTFAALFEASPDAILLVDFAGDMPIVQCNEVAARMRGYTREELTGQSTYLSLPGGAALLADHAANESFRQRVRETGRLYFDAEHLRKDGSIYPVEINLALVTLGGREMLLSVERDISARRDAEAALQSSQTRLLASEKLAGLGRLTAGLAHEINTPLAATMNELHEATRLTQEYQDSAGHPEVTPDDHREIARELGAALDAAGRNLTRIGDFIRKIRSHTRDAATGRHNFDAVRSVDDTLAMLAHEARAAQIQLHFERPREAVTLHGEPGRLTQIVTNLVVNGIHATPPGGTVTVRFGEQEGARTLQVEDTGSGIPTDVLPRIFEPMFTTKEVGKGTGLGLSIIHDIVTGHFGGEIGVQTHAGQGTTFTVSFPNKGPEAPADISPPVEATP